MEEAEQRLIQEQGKSANLELEMEKLREEVASLKQVAASVPQGDSGWDDFGDDILAGNQPVVPSAREQELEASCNEAQSQLVAQSNRCTSLEEELSELRQQLSVKNTESAPAPTVIVRRQNTATTTPTSRLSPRIRRPRVERLT